ncbi:MAG: hypothetical protein MZW92_23315 [Comamonadaceae bacterium]|nr:hypothetical protein [Comamonadaceae bacterium]
MQRSEARARDGAGRDAVGRAVCRARGEPPAHALRGARRPQRARLRADGQRAPGLLLSARTGEGRPPRPARHRALRDLRAGARQPRGPRRLQPLPRHGDVAGQLGVLRAADPQAGRTGAAGLAGASTPTAGSEPPVRWRVLGPSSSDGLRAMVLEAAAPGFDGRRLASLDLRYFSGAATVPDATLLQTVDAKQHDTVSAFLESRPGAAAAHDRHRRHAWPARWWRNSRAAACASAPRTARPPSAARRRTRRCRSAEAPPEGRPSSIAIVSEWDTLRWPRPAPAVQVHARCRRRSLIKEGFCVTRRHYVRGLDGRLPGDAAPPSADSRSKKDGKSDSLDSVGREGSYFERPEGQSQFDLPAPAGGAHARGRRAPAPSPRPGERHPGDRRARQRRLRQAARAADACTTRCRTRSSSPPTSTRACSTRASRPGRAT